jgi:hypothetical protein
MTSSLLSRRLCIMITLAASLLFLPLTFSANNTNNASAQSNSPSDVYDASDYYQDAIKAWQQCRERELPNMTPEEDCGPQPLPGSAQLSQPLDCNELQSCPTSASVGPPKDPRKLECGYEPYNCPLKTMCDGKRCEVIDCGMGTCPICPPGLGNLIIKSWCSYKCYPSGGAIIIIPILGRYLPSLPYCI